VAKSVIVLNEAKPSDSKELKALSDARVVKSVLAIVAANLEERLPPIVVELHSEQYRRLAENIAPGAVTTLNEADILARILVQTGTGNLCVTRRWTLMNADTSQIICVYLRLSAVILR
jgi:hypothetical protein